jgi:hypothetical protein
VAIFDVDPCGSRQTAGTPKYNASVNGLHSGTFGALMLTLNIIDMGNENLPRCATRPSQGRPEPQAKLHRVSSVSGDLIVWEL